MLRRQIEIKTQEVSQCPGQHDGTDVVQEGENISRVDFFHAGLYHRKREG
jgi:hypothetical protein